MSLFKGVSIGDLHFGIADSARLYSELKIFKDFIRKKDDIRLLVINGDYFDSKLSVGDSATFYAMSFFTELVSIVKEKKIIFRIIQGTLSHDLNQLQLFKAYENDTEMDFKIIYNVSTEEIDNLKILYLPEEYPVNSDDYYKDFMKGQYNLCFAHGTFDFVAQPGVIEHSKLNTHSAPVFMWKDWKKCFEEGFVSAGHIHGRNTYGKKIFYPGSFTRWNYGERSEKGFTYFEIDTDSKKYNVEYINNDLAPRYDVCSTDELCKNEEDICKIKTILDEAINKTDNMRVSLVGLSNENIELLKQYYANKPNVKLEVKDKKVMLKESSVVKTEEFKKWHYITKRSLPLDETIQKFCKEELDTKLNLDVIRKIIGKENA